MMLVTVDDDKIDLTLKMSPKSKFRHKNLSLKVLNEAVKKQQIYYNSNSKRNFPILASHKRVEMQATLVQW